MKKAAFTMLELIFVIVVIGILAAVFIPRFGQDSLSQATNQLISNIRYAQHLSMVDDEYDANKTNWYLNRWSINLCQPQYIVSRLNYSRVAVDPQTRADLNGSKTRQYDLSAKFGITLTAPSATCRIAFDHLGRPTGLPSGSNPTSSVSNLLHTPTDINLSRDGRTVQIRIEPETGYVHVL